MRRFAIANALWIGVVAGVACAPSPVSALAPVVVSAAGEAQGPPAEADPRPRVPREEPKVRDAPPDAVTVTVATISQIHADPQAYLGHSVRVQARVGRVFDPHAFALEDQDGAPGGGILVFNGDPADIPPASTILTVVGTVRPFVRSDLEHDYGFLQGRPTWEGTLPEWPVIIALSVRTAAGVELVRVPGEKGREPGSADSSAVAPPAEGAPHGPDVGTTERLDPSP